MHKNKGTFIVIDGSDGSGKATQTALLEKYLKNEKKKVKTIDFPRYKNNVMGQLIGECLAGEYGDFVALDPHIASVLYAADRFESSKQITTWLEEGNIVIADRYASANQIHQGGKISDPRKRKKFLEWLEKVEYGVFKIPRPDVIVYLDVPIPISQKLLQLNGKKEYTKGKGDQHENNVDFLEKSRRSALSIVKKSNNWVKINCVKKGEILSREEIHGLVVDSLTKYIQ